MTCLISVKHCHVGSDSDRADVAIKEIAHDLIQVMLASGADRDGAFPVQAPLRWPQHVDLVTYSYSLGDDVVGTLKRQWLWLAC